jgi:2-C-methyl-D-erythritol 2,4-cyclodiphosphate synthase
MAKKRTISGNMFRIGFGYDAHRLTEGRKLILGGIEIPYELGLEGHSDADVLTHAIVDALMGAMGSGDIGRHFPDTDPAYKNASSISLLNKTIEKLNSAGFRLNNIDTTIVAQAPKLASYIPRMRQRLGETCEVHEGQINIKATTTEGMGFCGRGEGIAAYAVVSIIKEDAKS